MTTIHIYFYSGWIISVLFSIYWAIYSFIVKDKETFKNSIKLTLIFIPLGWLVFYPVVVYYLLTKRFE